ncbi:pectinesterase inhibitor 9-like [Malania oleifera]|uniref:pectinesterase inhibitor 9-like n=1 Tax=Malania oleifera TaxID=397392 RepID=UPI0025ADB51B|nr:pectinesterase inhibitor 9-like [Malania oleifera]
MPQQHGFPTVSRLFLLSILWFISAPVNVEAAAARHSRARAFIEASCRSTLYPTLCVKTLSNFADNLNQFQAISPQQQLAQLTLSVGLVKAQGTREFLSNTTTNMKGIMSHSGSLDLAYCLDQINDGVTQLGRSIQELRRLATRRQRRRTGSIDSSDDPTWHISNIQTWLSAALTDANSCLDGFSGRGLGSNVKAAVKAKVLNVAQVTSNALALFNHFAAMYRTTSTSTVATKYKP